MKVFKFGGASVKDANSVKNIAAILKQYKGEDIVVVISAMGKMTNAFELLILSHCYSPEKVKGCLNEIVDFHNTILWELFPKKSHSVYIAINEFLYQLEELAEGNYSGEYDKTYDSIVGYGELMSTMIVSNYLSSIGIGNKWVDVREYIQTNSEFREAKVNWEETQKNMNQLSFDYNLVVTQGFIGGNKRREMTTLGREGSDFTASIFGYCKDAESVTIWKDVPGVLNADPKQFPDSIKIDKMSYREAIELSYYGASVIHPKTIKPLENKEIPLYVKSFLNPKEEGTVVQKLLSYDSLIPSFIFIENQVLVSISPKNFSFIAEENISFIFDKLHKARIKVNLIQNSALNFSVCFKEDTKKMDEFFNYIAGTFVVKYNKKVTLLTIRHYTEKVLEEMTQDKIIYLEQKTRNTARFIIK